MSIYDEIDFGNTPGNNVFGITIGVVTSIDDPDNIGRVKVRLLNRSNSNYETDFIRVATPMCGDEWGFLFLPEVGDEVLIGFCDGDITRPYVLGSLWNKNRKAPEKIKDKKNDNRVIKTKSGHMLKFCDESGKEHIEITTKGGLTVNLSDEKSSILLSDKNSSNKVFINSKDGAIEVESKKSISFKAGSSKIIINDNSISLETSGKLNIKAQQVAIEGQSQVNIKSSGQLSVETNGPASIKGAIVKIN